MASLTRGLTFGATETITNTKLHNLVDLGSVSGIVNADVAPAAAIAYSKLTLTGGIVNADINASAAIVDSKLAQITTASKVSGAALTSLASIPAGAGVVPIANLATGTADGTKFIRDDGTLQAISFPYIKFSNTQSSGTAGGTATSGTWRTVPLNTEDKDTASIASISSNQMSLPAGTYNVLGICPFSRTDRSQSRLQNITDGSTILNGQGLIAQNGTSQDYNSNIIGQFTIAATKTIEMQYQVQTTVSTTGLGNAASFGTEVYAQIQFEKVA